MKLDVDQKIVCSIEDHLIENILNAIDENDWHLDDYRNFADNMQDVNSIPIFHSSQCGISPDALLTVKKRKLFDKFYPLILPILDELKKYYDYNFHTSFMARLNPKGNIGIHEDCGDFLMRAHRIHVPLKTNENVIYYIDGKNYYWKRGFIYEFDNSLNHGVMNNSDQERIHLVLNLYKLSEDELKILNKI
jgi:hypothetical protein